MTSFSIRLYLLYTQFNIIIVFRVKKEKCRAATSTMLPGTYIIKFLYGDYLTRAQAYSGSYSPYSQPMCVASTSSTGTSAPSFLS